MARCILMTAAAAGIDPDDLTASAGDVLKGKIAGVAGSDEPVTGTLELTGNAAAKDIIKGKTAYTTDPKSKVTGTLELTGTAGAADIRKNKTAYTTDPKTKITGTMAELAAQTLKPGTTTKTLSCANKYMTGNVTVPAISIPASYIKKGQKITFPDGSSITGEFEGFVASNKDIYKRGTWGSGFSLSLFKYISMFGGSGDPDLTFNEGSATIDLIYKSDNAGFYINKAVNSSAYSSINFVVSTSNDITNYRRFNVTLYSQKPGSTISDSPQIAKSTAMGESTTEKTLTIDLSNINQDIWIGFNSDGGATSGTVHIHQIYFT